MKTLKKILHNENIEIVVREILNSYIIEISTKKDNIVFRNEDTVKSDKITMFSYLINKQSFLLWCYKFKNISDNHFRESITRYIPLKDILDDTNLIELLLEYISEINKFCIKKIEKF